MKKFLICIAVAASFLSLFGSVSESDFGKELQTKAKPIVDTIYHHPFVVSLIDGSLEKERFSFYVQQDWRYLNEFSAVLEGASFLAPTATEKETLKKFATDVRLAEHALHESFFKEYGIDKVSEELSPACFHYTNFLRATLHRGNYVATITALWPCFWIYEDVGKYILTNGSMVNNPYRKWIETYSGEDFSTSVRSMMHLVDRNTVGVGEKEKTALEKIHKASSQFEYDFWDDAYNLRVFGVREEA